MNKSWLNYFNLSDEYERKARFLPAVLSVLPLIPVAIAFGIPLLKWLGLIIAGTGLGVVISVAISHIASLFGNRLQDKLWPDWPYDSPTNRWLDPKERSVSIQQKQIWYKAIKILTNIDIQQAIEEEKPKELKVTINDAISSLRNIIWNKSEAKRVHVHNIDYGYARNLAGLRPIWITFSLGSLVGCWYAYTQLNGEIIWAIMSSVILIGSLILSILLPDYVLKKAHYYAESFFAAIVVVSEQNKKY